MEIEDLKHDMVLIEMIIDHLNDLADGQMPYLTQYGMCFELENFCKNKKIVFDWLDNLIEMIDFREWPLYSGEYGFPVPDPQLRFTPFDIYTITDNCWIGEYGQLRRFFCRWVAAKLKELTDNI